MPRHRFAFVVSVIIFSIAASSTLSRAYAQSAEFAGRNEKVPSPVSVLGFTPGADRTIADWQQITDYFARLDQASDRVSVETLGQTTLKRPLIVAFISAAGNLRELAKFKEIQRRLSDPRTIASEAERDSLIRDGKVIVAISCSIHSTEIVASQMSMQLAYQLATAEDEETRQILENTILLLIPSPNPDGIDIVAQWYRRTLGTPYEGTNPPELYHTYAGHDNNRDWFMLNLIETRLVTGLFWRDWFPQIVYDIHQQGQNGARFFIPPFYDPANPNIHPLLIREIAAMGSRVASDLQAANLKGVITSALYDTWWHGGFRTVPYYHHSIGILSEAASAKLMTPVHITQELLAKEKSRGMTSALTPATNYPDPWSGGVWSPGDIMALEMRTARSILSLAAGSRAAYLRNFYELGRNALNHSVRPSNPLGYVIPAGQGNDEAVARLIEILVAQGVEVHRLTRELHMSIVGHDGTFAEMPLNSYLIYLAQPARRNIQALFEPQVYPNRMNESGEPEPPYDVAGWTLPMQMGVEIESVAAIREDNLSAQYLKLVTDAAEVRGVLALALPDTSGRSPIPNPIKPRVRLAVYKSRMASMDEGWTRWVLDTFNVPYDSLLDADVRRGNLGARYDVILLPSQRAKDIVEGNRPGSYPEEFTGGIQKQGVEHLRQFVREGGTLICFDASTELAIKHFKLPLRNVLEGVTRKKFYCPGSIVRLELEVKEPLARGMSPQTDAYFINSQAFDSKESQRVRVVARYARRELLRSGWMLGESYIAGRIALAEVDEGRGRIVLFGFRPQHRGQTWATFPFIFNAIMRGLRAEM